MQKILHITNGDVAVGIMQQAGIEGDILPWRDVLHQGPVPAGLSLSELSAQRAQFIAGQGWAPLAQTQASFKQRDAQLCHFMDYDAVVLWFEHDLYDQLHILQLLDWFCEQDLETTPLGLVCSENYLGMLEPDELLALGALEQPVTVEQLVLANRVWQAYREPEPLALQDILQQDTRALPFLQGAIARLMEEYPHDGSGLSRTAMNALQIIEAGVAAAGEVFNANQQLETRHFMGDTVFYSLLNEMLHSSMPLLECDTADRTMGPQLQLRISDAGKAVLQGECNWLKTHPIDRWIGGVHLSGHNIWSWNVDMKTLVNYSIKMSKH